MSNDYQDVRQHILDSGMAIIAGKGFAAVGLNEILSSAAVPKGSFYHYFKSKEAFGVALVDSYAATYAAQMNAVLDADGSSAADRLMRYWHSWFSSEGCEVRCLVVKLSGEVSDLSDAMRLALLAGTSQIVARLAACIAEGVADGSLDQRVEPEHLAQTLYELWLGAALLTKLRRDNSALDGALRATRALLQLPA